jgi:hypothetical protein
MVKPEYILNFITSLLSLQNPATMIKSAEVWGFTYVKMRIQVFWDITSWIGKYVPTFRKSLLPPSPPHPLQLFKWRHIPQALHSLHSNITFFYTPSTSSYRTLNCQSQIRRYTCDKIAWHQFLFRCTEGKEKVSYPVCIIKHSALKACVIVEV